VKLHRNAKTTPHMRALLVDRVRVMHWPVATAANAAGISTRTAYKWLARQRTGGRSALEDRPSTPHRQPRRTPEAQVQAILAARQARLTGWAIAVRVQVPRSTVAAILARHGLNRLAALEARPPVQRYEWAHPGELVHLDVKRLARIVRVGHRIHGNRSLRVYGAGWEYVHVAVDDHSRVAYTAVLPDQTGRSAEAFLRRTVRWFAQRGTVVSRILTDNGSGFISRRFRAAAAKAGVRLKRTRFYRPQTNGKAERFIQTLLREWAYVRPYRSSSKRTQALGPWVRQYNIARPHTALDYQPPCSRFPRAAQ
jgi:transposase InsO family protein